MASWHLLYKIVFTWKSSSSDSFYWQRFYISQSASWKHLNNCVKMGIDLKEFYQPYEQSNINWKANMHLTWRQHFLKTRMPCLKLPQSMEKQVNRHLHLQLTAKLQDKQSSQQRVREMREGWDVYTVTKYRHRFLFVSVC